MDEYLKAIKSLSEHTRIRIIALLQQVKEICVSDIVHILQESQYKISRHLKVLQEAGLIKGYKKGRWIYYRLNSKQADFHKLLLNTVNHITSDTIKSDLKRLQDLLDNQSKLNCPGSGPEKNSY